MHRGEGLDTSQRALQLADVALDLVRDEVQHLFRNQASVVAELGMKDREASLEIRRLDVGDETPLEPRTQAVLERGNFLGRTVGRDDDLLVDLVQRLDSLEALFSGAVVAGES